MQIASPLRFFAKLFVLFLIPVCVQSEVRFSVFTLESGNPTNVIAAKPGSILEIWIEATLTDDEELSGVIYRFAVSNDPGWVIINREFGVFNCKDGGESTWEQGEDNINLSRSGTADLPAVLENKSDQIDAAASFSPEIDFYFDS